MLAENVLKLAQRVVRFEISKIAWQYLKSLKDLNFELTFVESLMLLVGPATRNFTQGHGGRHRTFLISAHLQGRLLVLISNGILIVASLLHLLWAILSYILLFLLQYFFLGEMAVCVGVSRYISRIDS